MAREPVGRPVKRLGRTAKRYLVPGYEPSKGAIGPHPVMFTSPAADLAALVEVSDFEYVEPERALELRGIVWAHRVDASPPNYSPELHLAVFLDRWCERNPDKALAPYWLTPVGWRP